MASHRSLLTHYFPKDSCGLYFFVVDFDAAILPYMVLFFAVAQTTRGVDVG